MKTLTIGDAMKSLAFLAAGISLGAFLLGPINVGAQSDDDGPPPIVQKEEPPTFVLQSEPAQGSITGEDVTFVLVETISGFVLTRVEETADAPLYNDDDD